jgi:hypothetical protein
MIGGMKEPEPDQHVVLPLSQRPHVFLATVRRLAAVQANINWSGHARKRFAGRDITIRMALDVLSRGGISGKIVCGENVGEWKAKIIAPITGRRTMGVATILVRESLIFVKTVEWED